MNSVITYDELLALIQDWADMCGLIPTTAGSGSPGRVKIYLTVNRETTSVMRRQLVDKLRPYNTNLEWAWCDIKALELWLNR